MFHQPTVTYEGQLLPSQHCFQGTAFNSVADGGIMTSEQRKADLLIDWFRKQDEMPTEAEIYQAAIEITLEG